MKLREETAEEKARNAAKAKERITYSDGTVFMDIHDNEHVEVHNHYGDSHEDVKSKASTSMIKYRAKDLDGWWCYGMPIDANNEHYMLTDTPNECNYDGFEWRINHDGLLSIKPNTLGRYIGKIDENGKGIYEGDILEIDYKHNGLGPNGGIVPDQDCMCKGVLYWSEDEYCYNIRIIEAEAPISRMMREEECDSFPLAMFDLEVIEVIGNIFDNPNLL